MERLNEGLRQNQGFGRKLAFISAPAGFGKTTFQSHQEWIFASDTRKIHPSTGLRVIAR